MSEKMPNSEELEKIQKENLTKEQQIEKEKISEDEISAMLNKSRDALQILINEEKNLSNTVRYMLVRPFKRMVSSDPDKILDEAGDLIMNFCKKIGEPYPTTLNDKELLLKRMDDPEIRQKLSSI